jgi:hypothetical protein
MRKINQWMLCGEVMAVRIAMKTSIHHAGELQSFYGQT